MACSLCAFTAPPLPKKPILLRTSLGNLDSPLLPFGTGFSFFSAISKVLCGARATDSRAALTHRKGTAATAHFLHGRFFWLGHTGTISHFLRHFSTRSGHRIISCKGLAVHPKDERSVGHSSNCHNTLFFVMFLRIFQVLKDVE